MLAVLSRSLNNYYLYAADNKVQPPEFIGNKVAGILFENKIDHTTYFGTNIEYIQGIHMLPLLPSTKYTRPSEFVSEEWTALFNQGRADLIEGGWRGILYGNLATIDATSAWQFFTKPDFNPSWLDGGASLTWYQAYAAGKLSCRHVDCVIEVDTLLTHLKLFYNKLHQTHDITTGYMIQNDTMYDTTQPTSTIQRRRRHDDLRLTHDICGHDLSD